MFDPEQFAIGSAVYRAIGFEQVGICENYYGTTRGGSREEANILRLEVSRPRGERNGRAGGRTCHPRL